jgi:hypothetical protein
VGKVEAFTVAGLELWFWSGDHAPPHFHVKKAGEWEIRVSFLESTEKGLPFEVKWGIGPNRHEQKVIAGLVRAHRAVLLAEWELKVRQE